MKLMVGAPFFLGCGCSGETSLGLRWASSRQPHAPPSAIHPTMSLPCGQTGVRIESPAFGVPTRAARAALLHRTATQPQCTKASHQKLSTPASSFSKLIPSYSLYYSLYYYVEGFFLPPTKRTSYPPRSFLHTPSAVIHTPAGAQFSRQLCGLPFEMPHLLRVWMRVFP